MSSDAFSPITTSRTLQTPKGHRIYTTTRDVASEYPLPAIGSLLSETNFIAGFSGHYVLDVTDSPKGNGKRVTVTHGSFPSGTFTEYESLAYTFPALYPLSGAVYPLGSPTAGAVYAGGSRPRSRVVTARVAYEYRLAPGDWLTAASLWNYSDPATGPFEVISFIAEAAGAAFVGGDGTPGQVGNYLNLAFIGMDTVNDEIEISVPGDLSYNINPSVPSGSVYNSWIILGTELMASRRIFKWYCGYGRQTTYVKAQ